MKNYIKAVLAALLLLAAPASAQVPSIQTNEVLFGVNPASSPRIVKGTGSPEGVNASCVGSVYLRTDGGTSSSVYFKETGVCTSSGWVAAGAGGGSASHNLLSATHTDTSSAAAIRGAIIFGNSSPAWARLTPTTAGQFPRYNGTDTAWSLDGSLFEDLNASELTGGTLPDARLSSNVSLFGSAVDSSEITNATIVFADWASNSCSTNQIPKYNGAVWACSTDETGSGGGDHSILSVTHTDTVPDTLVEGDILVVGTGDLLTRLAPGTTGQVLTIDGSGVPGWDDPSGGVAGPGSSTDNAVARWDGAGGSTLQDSVVTIGDTGVVSGAVFGNAGLKIQDTNASHNLIVSPGSDITADRTLTITTGDSDRTLTFTGNATVSGTTSGTNTGDQTTSGTSNEISVASGSTNPVISLPSAIDLGGKTVEIPNGTSLPGTCNVGEMYMDTDATTGQRFYLCQSSNTWALQGDGGGGAAYSTVQDEGSNLTQRATINFTGSGVSCVDNGGSTRTDCTITGGAGGSTTDWSIRLSALSYFPPSSNPATPNTRNSTPVLEFDTTTQEGAYFVSVLPQDYASSGITVCAHWAAASATSGTIGWDVAIERIGDGSQDLDADGFGSATNISATTVPGTSGLVDITCANISDGSNMDSLAAGEAFRLRIRRDVTNDDATGDAQLVALDIREQSGSGTAGWITTFSATANNAPSSNPATFNVRNTTPVLQFDTTTQEGAVFLGVLPNVYGGSGVNVCAHWAAASATSGTIGWDVAFERIGDGAQDLDADSFATAQTITATTVPGTSGLVDITCVNISDGANMDSLVAGETFRLRIRRDVSNDNATGDADLLMVSVKEQ